MKDVGGELVPWNLLSGDRVELTPIRPEHYEFLYWLASAGQNSARWRYRMQVPPFEIFVQQLHQDVLAQFVVLDRSSSEPIGHAVGYSADLRSGYCYVAAVVSPERVGSGVGKDAIDLLVDYLAMVWPLRKVYAEVPAFTFEHFAAIGHTFQERGSRAWDVEGSMREHIYCAGRYWDMHIVSVTLS